MQYGFLALTLAGVFLVQGNAERWCPFGGLESFYTYLAEGDLVCSLAVSNFYLLAAVLLSALLLRRIFCSHACPVGTLSEALGRLGARLGLGPARVAKPADRGLSLLKYAVLGIVLYFTWRTGELVLRGFDPCYALISRHGEDITFWAYGVSGGVALASLFIALPFCRWLCPLAAVLNPFSRAGLARVRRDPGACTGCGSCAKHCPMAIPVDRPEPVTQARCTLCLDCVEACPERSAGALSLAPFAGRGAARAPRRLPAFAAGAIFLLLIGAGVSASIVLPLPSFVWSRGEPAPRSAIVDLTVQDLTCRGRANLLVYYLERDDELELPGYLKVEAWPAPGAGRARIHFDPDRADASMIHMALTQAYFDAQAGRWLPSPFSIEGYDPLK